MRLLSFEIIICPGSIHSEEPEHRNEGPDQTVLNRVETFLRRSWYATWYRLKAIIPSATPWEKGDTLSAKSSGHDDQCFYA